MEDWKSQLWIHTKKTFKDLIDALCIFGSFLFVVYSAVFNSADHMKLAQTIIGSENWYIITLICLGMLIVTIQVDKIFRFIFKITWLIISSSFLYIYRKIKN